MDSVGAPPPPPPPPMLNLGAINNGRSQLLADIRNGATLKKTHVTNDSNELSPSDKLKKQTKDLLHAELTSTLKRRKPVVINDPPKYEYPTYDSRNNDDGSINSNKNNNNTTANNNKVNNDSSHSTSACVSNTSPLNVSAVLSVVTGIKLPDIQYDPNTSTNKSQVADKQKISHGKPNFTINQRENKSAVVHQPIIQQTSPKLQIKPLEIKFQHLNSSTSNDNVSNKISETKSVPNVESQSQIDKCKSIFSIKSQKSIDFGAQKSPKSQPKSDVGFKFENGPTTSNVNETPKEMLNRKNSVMNDDPMNGISFASVANKKALFEKPAEDANHSKTVPLKSIQTEKLYFNKPVMRPNADGKSTTMINNRTINYSQQKPNVTTVALNKNISYGTLDRPMEQQGKDKIDHRIEKSTHTVNKTSTTNGLGQYETKYIEQKTFVSFSKDLLNAPNNYPEHVRVKKTIITNHSNAIPDNPFHSIRFSIKNDGQVIPKPK